MPFRTFVGQGTLPAAASQAALPLPEWIGYFVTQPKATRARAACPKWH